MFGQLTPPGAKVKKVVVKNIVTKKTVVKEKYYPSVLGYLMAENLSQLTRSAQTMRPLYVLFADQSALLQELQQQYQLPSLEQMADETTRLHSSQMVAIYRELAFTRGIADIGLQIGSHLSPGCLGSLSFLLMAAANLRELLGYLCHYYPIIAEGEQQPKWTEQGGQFCLEFFVPQGDDDVRAVRGDCLIAGAHRLLTLAGGNHYRPMQMEVVGDGGDYRTSYGVFLGGASIVFNGKSLKIFADASSLDEALPSANPSLCKVFRKELDVQLKALMSEQTVIDQVQRILVSMENLSQASLGTMAKQLHVSERTLSRQLSEYGVSFRELLANFKSTRAIRLLAGGKPVDQVAYYLGFSERAAFDRAFKKWQGVTASRFQADYQRVGASQVSIVEGEPLPNLPMVASQLLKLLDQPHCEMDELAVLVEQDPILTAKLLALANSAMYGVVEVSCIKEAIVRVFGVDTLRNLALAMLANDCFDARRCPAFTLRDYWLHSLATGQLAAKLAKCSGLDVAVSDVYLLGLLHNIGSLLLVERRAEDMGRFYLEHEVYSLSLSERSDLEMQALGVDACGAGAMLASFWHLPRYLTVSIRGLAVPDYKGEYKELVNLVEAAEALLRALNGFGDREQAEKKLVAIAGIKADKLKSLIDDFSEHYADIEAAANALC